MTREIDPTKPYFTIGAVAEIIGVKPRMLRTYEDQGLIKPKRTDGNRRLYSLGDIDELSYYHYLHRVQKVNIAGIKEITQLLQKIKPETRMLLLQEAEERINNLSKEDKEIFEGKIEGTVISEV